MRLKILAVLALLVAAPAAWSFCGFYVAQADAKLFNKSSRVLLTRNGDETVMTMANDYSGSLTDFAIVVPVPVVVKKEQVEIADMGLIDRIDAYSAPRLAEYYDPDPCRPQYEEYGMADMAAAPTMATRGAAVEQRKSSVRIEASYTVGEYDILILSATDSGDLQRWLSDNGYKVPPQAAPILGSYIAQNMRFFVAKVNLKAQAQTGQWLRPLRIRYTSPKFMLPIRLGMVNADGVQDLFVYTITQRGRVETTNYRTRKMPTDVELPPYIKNDFGSFYKAVFDRQVRNDGMTAVYTEYAWPLSIMCDPCSADPITTEELQGMGARWVGDGQDFQTKYFNAAYLTRLHVRYDLAHFPEDLVFQETADSSTFQARYVIRHPFQGDLSCPAGQQYAQSLRARQSSEVATLANLTGWYTNTIWPNVYQVPGAQPVETPKEDGGFWDW